MIEDLLSRLDASVVAQALQGRRSPATGTAAACSKERLAGFGARRRLGGTRQLGEGAEAVA